ncbi:unnamed protein product [Dimorphilus gyrociliatus]|uniref:Uncharacterized protein n=1 Tax=Dimorphilus gyrociliatus TaxID=2664684 RepID=A0A7I8VX53_9ANNE|nr:unnamed protein product [Dimorphilus gyrociliatus]
MNTKRKIIVLDPVLEVQEDEKQPTSSTSSKSDSGSGSPASMTSPYENKATPTRPPTLSTSKKRKLSNNLKSSLKRLRETVGKYPKRITWEEEPKSHFSQSARKNVTFDPYLDEPVVERKSKGDSNTDKKKTISLNIMQNLEPSKHERYIDYLDEDESWPF